MQVAADHDDAVANAAVDVQAAADDDRGVGHLFVALDADVLAEGDARAGQPIGGGVRWSCADARGVNEQTDGQDRASATLCASAPHLLLRDEGMGPGKCPAETVPGGSATVSFAPVASSTASSVVSEAISRSTSPSGVTSITASSVTMLVDDLHAGQRQRALRQDLVAAVLGGVLHRNHDALRAGDEVHRAAHALDHLAGDHPVGEVALPRRLRARRAP